MQENGHISDFTRNFLGPRGIDMIQAQRLAGPENDPVKLQGARSQFPLYDGHGNMVASLIRTGTNGHELVNQRRYDAWGGLSQSSGPGGALANPSEAYCANLGHKLDLESGLIYMRARYYEPTSGRFVSQDPAMDGWNWYTYCGNDPLNAVDESGTTRKPICYALMAVFWLMFTNGLILIAQLNTDLNQGAGEAATTSQKMTKAAAKKCMVIAFASLALATGVSGWDDQPYEVIGTYAIDTWLLRAINTIIDGAEAGGRGHGSFAVKFATIYAFVICKYIVEAL